MGLKLFSKRWMLCVVAAYRGVLPASRRKEKPPLRLDLCMLDSQPLSLFCSLAPGSRFSCDPLVWVAHTNHVASRVQSRVLGMTHGTSPLLPASLPALVLTPSATQSGHPRWTQEHAFSQSSPGSARHPKLSWQTAVEKLKTPFKPLFFCSQGSGKAALESVSVTKSPWLRSKAESCYG